MSAEICVGLCGVAEKDVSDGVEEQGAAYESPGYSDSPIEKYEQTVN